MIGSLISERGVPSASENNELHRKIREIELISVFHEFFFVHSLLILKKKILAKFNLTRFLPPLENRNKFWHTSVFSGFGNFVRPILAQIQFTCIAIFDLK